MRVGLTVDSLSPRLTGIGRYTWELCQGLREKLEISDLGFFRYDDWIARPEAFLTPRARQRFRLPRRLRRWRSQGGFKNRLIHGTNYFLPSLTERGLLTVHDLSVFLYPEAHPAERIRIFDKDFASSMARASHFITDSETVKGELAQHFGLSPNRITAIPLGVSPAYHPRSQAETVRYIARLLGPDVQDYVLTVATFEPRKRIEAAVRSHALMCARTGKDIPLVLVGAVGWRNEALHQEIESARNAGRVKLLGYVPEAALPFLYAGARLFLYPSIYEGFGLPPVEAMSSGVPTIVSDRSCLPEVTAGAALLADPDDIEGLSLIMEQAFYDEALRADRIAAGLTVAAGYSWAACVDRTLDVYRQMGG